MKEYIDFVLKKTKRPINIEKIVKLIEDIKREEDSSFDSLSWYEKKEIEELLIEGTLNYEYFKTDDDNYILLSKTNYRHGVFNGTKNGDGYVSVVTSYFDKNNQIVVKEEKYDVSKNDCNGAIDGDSVFISIGTDKHHRICEVLDRNLSYLAGEVFKIGSKCYVKAVDKKKQSLTVVLDHDAIEGQKVLVRLKKSNSNNFYTGDVVKVFGHKNDPDDDILWEAYKLGIDPEFSDEALKELEYIPDHVRDVDKIGRMDLTNWEVFTIDGDDTKDIDDALSIKKLDNGNYLVGVHIADVSHYVKQGSALDRDAFKRGNSYYFGGKVIPMLAAKLSNGICSLNPEVERLAMSCLMEVNSEGEVINHTISPTVIKSQKKMTYSKVNNLLKNGVVDDDYCPHEKSLLLLSKLALVLRNKRINAGSLEFNRPEIKPIYDENGRVSRISVREQDVAENLIEEFMLLANETVDKHLVDLGYPCLHRVHNHPNVERLNEFLKMLEAINLPFDRYSAAECVASNKILQKLQEHVQKAGRLSEMLITNLIKCFSRARYSPVNIGHSGLFKSNYCHFTSPIRRYSDLTIHRILKDAASNKKQRDVIKYWATKLPSIGAQTSKTEKMADDGERQVLSMKCAEYMQNHIGDEYSGTVVGVSPRGLLIQLDDYLEGRVRINNMIGDYTYNPGTYSLVSLDDQENYYIGDRLNLTVLAASKEDKVIDFGVLCKLEENYIEKSEKSNQYVKRRALEKRNVS
ncbi:MAG: VacB/RNase II family 3'-5' exoribonuclease [Bacilli bacterium]|nr:VacB/RNase II family 3'-5' exoribonuclease [Bacilli bacterium]